MSFGKATLVSIVFHCLFLALMPFLYQRPEFQKPERKQINLVVLQSPRPAPEPERAAAPKTEKPAAPRPKPRKTVQSKPKVKPRPEKKLPGSDPKPAAVPDKSPRKSLPRVPVMPEPAVSFTAGQRRDRAVPRTDARAHSASIDDVVSEDIRESAARRPESRNDRPGNESSLPEVSELLPESLPASEPLDVSTRRLGVPVRTSRRDFASSLDFGQAASPAGPPPAQESGPGKPDSLPKRLRESRFDRPTSGGAGDTRRPVEVPAAARRQSAHFLDHLVDEPAVTESETPPQTGETLTIPSSRELMSTVRPDDGREDGIRVGERTISGRGNQGRLRVQTDPGEVEFARGTINTRPRFLHWIAPTYPAQAERTGNEGKVKLRLEVSDTGKVEHVTVVENTAGEILAAAARETAYQWKLEPVLVDGIPVDVVVYKTIYFILENRE